MCVVVRVRVLELGRTDVYWLAPRASDLARSFAEKPHDSACRRRRGMGCAALVMVFAWAHAAARPAAKPSASAEINRSFIGEPSSAK